MSWFGGRGETQAVPEKTDMVESFEQSTPNYESKASPDMIQRLVLQEQQKVLVQQVIAKLTEVSFDQCVDRPEASLTSRQRACIHTVVGKYLDTSEFVLGRTTKR